MLRSRFGKTLGEVCAADDRTLDAEPDGSAGVSTPSSSMKRPPPPGPPGTYRLFFRGGSVAGAPDACLLLREVVAEPPALARALGRLWGRRRGVDGAGAMAA